MWILRESGVNGCFGCAEISDSLEGLGRRIARHPYLVITLSVIFATVWGTVFFRFSVENRRIETLYTPKNAQSVRDKEYALAKFGQPPQEVSERFNMKHEHIPIAAIIVHVLCHVYNCRGSVQYPNVPAVTDALPNLSN